ncbi:MAG: hypothetical protein HYR91_00320, partial [Flavobacteriia bacterium]|nr:hypothetical protein [Flavobacteriia bacterium]
FSGCVTFGKSDLNARRNFLPEIKGEGNSVNYEYRMHDPRVGRFFAVDPLAKKYPHNGPYNFSENCVINAIELEELESLIIINSKWFAGEIQKAIDNNDIVEALRLTNVAIDKGFASFKKDEKNQGFTIMYNKNPILSCPDAGKLTELTDFYSEYKKVAHDNGKLTQDEYNQQTKNLKSTIGELQTELKIAEDDLLKAEYYLEQDEEVLDALDDISNDIGNDFEDGGFGAHLAIIDLQATISKNRCMVLQEDRIIEKQKNVNKISAKLNIAKRELSKVIHKGY